jgi:hypothetical protein
MHHSVDLGHSLSVDFILDIDHFQERSHLEDQISIVSNQSIAESQSIDKVDDSAGHETARPSARPSASRIQINVPPNYVPSPNDQEPDDTEHDSIGPAQETIDMFNDTQSNRDSQQNFADVTSDFHQMDDPTLLLFELMMKAPRSLPQHGSAKGHRSNTMVLRPVFSGDSARELGNESETSSGASALPLGWIGHCKKQAQVQFLSENGRGYSDANSRLLRASTLRPTLNTQSVAEKPVDDLACSLAPSSSDQEPADDGTELFLPNKAYGDEISGLSFSAVRSQTVAKTAPLISSHPSASQARLLNDCDPPNLESREISISNSERLSLFPDPASPTAEPFAAGGFCEDIFRGESFDCKPNDQDKNEVSAAFSRRGRLNDIRNDFSSSNQSTPVFPFREETRPNLIIQRGRSLLRHMPKIFQNNRQGKQTNRRSHQGEDKNPSISRDHFRSITGKAGWCTTTRGHSSTDLGPKPTTIARTFDGAGDVNNTQSAMDLNKALPPQPHSSKEKEGLSTITATSPLIHSQEANPQPSPASIGSSNSRVSSKELFQRTAPHLAHPESAESKSTSLTQNGVSDDILVASKYDPLACPKLRDP